MSGTCFQVWNPPNLYSSLYLIVELTDSLIKISRTIKKTATTRSDLLHPNFVEKNSYFTPFFLESYFFDEQSEF